MSGNAVDVDPCRVLSLCSGAGGLDLGLRLAVPGARTVCYVERDPDALRVLGARVRDGWLDCAPIWDDVVTFDARAWGGAVDLVLAGFPCQPVSTAGRRAGAGDERWLWDDVARCYADSGARWLAVENVRGLVSLGLDRVLGTLAELGCSAEWLCLRASEVGAPHRRERWFCVADRGSNGLQGRARAASTAGAISASRGALADARCGDVERWRESRIMGRPTSDDEGQGVQQKRSRESSCRGGAALHVADRKGDRRHERIAESAGQLGGSDVAERGGEVGNANGRRREGVGLANTRDEQRASWAVPDRHGRAWPPGPAEHDEWRAIIASDPTLAPAVAPQRPIRGVVDGLARWVDVSRAARLRLCGNGVVPAQAGAAFTELFRRLNGRREDSSERAGDSGLLEIPRYLRRGDD